MRFHPLEWILFSAVLALPIFGKAKENTITPPTPDAVLSPAGLPLVSLPFKGVTVTAEVANDNMTRGAGLRFRKGMGKDEGMLFVFPFPQILQFWNKDAPLPFDVAFLDDKGTVLNLGEFEADSEAVLDSKGPAKYALEMNKGWFTGHKVRTGDVIAGVLDAPPDTEAGQKPPFPLNASQMAWGKTQLRQMLKDRPAMAKYVKEGDDLWNWTVRQFAGEYVKGGVQWDPGNPGGDFDSTSDGPNSPKGRAYIQDTLNYAVKTFHTGEPKTGPVLWWEAAEELCNLQNRYRFDAINAEARAGKIGRTDYAFEMMAEEDIVTERGAYDFFQKVWAPNCEKLSLQPIDSGFEGRFGHAVGAGWSRGDFMGYFKNQIKPDPDPGQTDYQKMVAKDFAQHYKWYVDLYDKYVSGAFTKNGLPLPPAGPSEEVEKKFLDEIAPVTPAPTVSAEDQKAMDSVPPPP